MDTQLQTFPYQMMSEAFPCFNALMAKSLAQTPPFKSVTDKQKKQTANFFIPCAKSEPQQT